MNGAVRGVSTFGQGTLFIDLYIDDEQDKECKTRPDSYIYCIVVGTDDCHYLLLIWWGGGHVCKELPGITCHVSTI